MQKSPHSLIAAVLLFIVASLPLRAETVVTVETPQALQSALKSVQPGTTILLEPGTYGDLNFNFGGTEFAPAVQIKSANTQRRARIRTLTVSNVSGLSISGVDFEITVTSTTPAGLVGVALNDTSNVTLANLRMTGADAIAGVSADTDPNTTNSKTTFIGRPLGTAIYTREARNLAITGNTITGFHRGITLVHGSDVLVADNEIYDMRGTPFRSISIDRIAVLNNRFHSFHPVSFGGQGDHADHIIFQPDKKDPDPVRDVVIEGNLLQQGDGESILGIILASRQGLPGYERVLIQNNILRNADGAGIVLEGVRKGIVRRNTLVPSQQVTKRAPYIRVWFECAELIVTENITPRIFVQQTDNDISTIRVEKNFILEDRIQDYSRNIAGFFDTDDWANAVLTRRDFKVSNKMVGKAFGATIN